MVKTKALPKILKNRRHYGGEGLLFPGRPAPPTNQFDHFRVRFVFMGYHPEDGEFHVTFLAECIQAENQDEAIEKALAIAKEKYKHYGFDYQIGGKSGSGAFLIYKNMRHVFVRASSKKEALRRVGGNQCFSIQVKPLDI
ncbi:MAG: hypothetical protein V1807_01965 [Patescibacteria group bacterium]